MRIFGCVCPLLLLAGLCSAQDTNFPVGPQYLMTSGSPQFARPIATPSLSFATALPQAETGEPSQAQVPTEQYQAISYILDLQRQDYLPSVYWGAPMVSVVEISFREPAGEEPSRPELPASITESGVTALTGAETLRQRGVGVTLAEAARHLKSHKSAAPHVYTNSDIERLRGGS